MAKEIELKLEMTPEAAAFLEASPLLNGAMKKADLRSRYFDTPGRELARHGLSLRIRRKGRSRVQTVKASTGPASGLFSRSEWEMPVTGDIPMIDDRTPVPSLLGKNASMLQPVFDVRVERRTWIVLEGDASIELALDRGAALIGDRRAPICEVELELKTGPAAALFTLARKLGAVAPVRLSVLSKSERGYRLLDAAPLSFKAEPVRIATDASTAESFRHIANLCLRQYRLNEALLLESRASEALHQARVAIRRLRSALAIFKAILADDQFAHLRTEFKALAAILGEARNIDVLLERTPPGTLGDRLGVARDGAYADVEAALASDRIRGLMLDFVEWLADGAWLDDADRRKARDKPAAIFAATVLRHVRKQVKLRGEGLHHLKDAERHEVRKLAKKLRYSAEFFVALFPGRRQQRRYRKFLGALERLQDKLGGLNDLVMAPEVLGQFGLIDEPDASSLLHGPKRSKLLLAAADAYDDLMDAPKFWA